jgi:hypothetical protein
MLTPAWVVSHSGLFGPLVVVTGSAITAYKYATGFILLDRS